MVGSGLLLVTKSHMLLTTKVTCTLFMDNKKSTVLTVSRTEFSRTTK